MSAGPPPLTLLLTHLSASALPRLLCPPLAASLKHPLTSTPSPTPPHPTPPHPTPPHPTPPPSPNPTPLGALSQNEALLHQKRADFESREAASAARRRQMDEERRAADERKRAEEDAKQAERCGKYELSLQQEEDRKKVRGGWEGEF